MAKEVLPRTLVCQGVYVMASIIKKKKGNQVYYYAAECQRVNGKPRIVWQTYLGKLEDIIRKVKNDGTVKPYTAKVFDFGLVAAIYSIAEKLQVKEIIDRIAPKRNQGLSVGTYILIAAINRATEPTSKRKMAEWYKKTVLRRLMPLDPKLLTSQRFWDHMGYLDKQRIRQCEDEIVKQMVKTYDLNLDTVVYDATNFFTYINTTTDSELAQRGYNKQKRDDLRQVSLALMATSDFLVPLLYELYPGNVLDHQEFESLTERLAERYKMLAGEVKQITMVLDKGNINKKTMKRLNDSPYSFVCSLSTSHHEDLLQVPESEFVSLTGDFAGEKAYCTERTVFGVKGKAVVVSNESLRVGQLQGILTNIRKATNAIKRLQKKLEARRTGKVTRSRKPTVKSVTKQIEESLSRPYLKQIFKVQITEKEGIPSVDFEVDYERFREIAEVRLGKTILFTDRIDWSPEQVIAVYRGGAAFEANFHYLKDADLIRWHPSYHWTDPKILVHAFYCILALIFQALLHKTVSEAGVSMSREEILETLAGIEEVVHIYPKDAGVKDHFTLSQMDDKQQQLYQVLELDRYAP